MTSESNRIKRRCKSIEDSLRFVVLNVNEARIVGGALAKRHRFWAKFANMSADTRKRPWKETLRMDRLVWPVFCWFYTFSQATNSKKNLILTVGTNFHLQFAPKISGKTVGISVGICVGIRLPVQSALVGMECAIFL